MYNFRECCNIGIEVKPTTISHYVPDALIIANVILIIKKQVVIKNSRVEFNFIQDAPPRRLCNLLNKSNPPPNLPSPLALAFVPFKFLPSSTPLLARTSTPFPS